MVHARAVKEANGTPLFGFFTLYLAKELTKNIGQWFKIDMQFPVIKEMVKQGAKPAYDGAICAILSFDDNRELKPVILYEYKPTVDVRFNHVNHHYLMEVFIQGYYCLR